MCMHDFIFNKGTDNSKLTICFFILSNRESTIVRRETTLTVLLQTVKTQIKCREAIFRERSIAFVLWKIITSYAQYANTDHPALTISKFMDSSIGQQRVICNNEIKAVMYISNPL